MALKYFPTECLKMLQQLSISLFSPEPRQAPRGYGRAGLLPSEPAVDTALARPPSAPRAAQHSPRSRSRPPRHLSSSHSPGLLRKPPGRRASEAAAAPGTSALSRQRPEAIAVPSSAPGQRQLLLHSGPAAPAAPLQPWAAAFGSHSPPRAALPVPGLCQRSRHREELETVLLRLKNPKSTFWPALLTRLLRDSNPAGNPRIGTKCCPKEGTLNTHLRSFLLIY